jgi:alpha-ketoglutarate-dependent taurine dioxygenase
MSSTLTTLTTLGTTLGARIDGTNLAELTEQEWSMVAEAFERHGVLVFPNQQLSREQHIEFAQRFGPIEVSDDQGILGSEKEPMVVDISNVDREGRHIRDHNHPQTRYLAANEGWHSDSSFKLASAKASCLNAMEVTTVGGQTEFADMRAAYDMLTPERAVALAELVAWHSLQYAQASVAAIDEPVPEDPTRSRGAWHPVVRHHPDSGRASLFIGRHACAVKGMPVTEAQALLSELVDWACDEPRVYSHHWSVGDVVIWDNRCVLHRATEWDLHERRVLRHVRIAGPEWT